jgi:hypothetical protein
MPEFAKSNFVVEKDPSGHMALKSMPVAPLPADLQRIVEEMK